MFLGCLEYKELEYFREIIIVSIVVGYTQMPESCILPTFKKLLKNIDPAYIVNKQTYGKEKTRSAQVHID